jgi:hypothetical protein
MRRTLSVDPGKQHAGWALFEDGVLKSCGYVEGEDDIEVAEAVADEIYGDVDLLVCENQQVYARGKGDPNDLLPLARTVGAVRMVFADVPEKTLTLPRVWTNGVPKAPRQRAFERRYPVEFAAVKALGLKAECRHDVVDAVHLGIWVLEERRERKRPA